MCCGYEFALFIYFVGVCSEPFGLGWNRRVPDYRFTASSFYRTGTSYFKITCAHWSCLIVIIRNSVGEWNASADNARLYMEDDFTNFRIGSWCAEYPPRQGEWLKIDLGRTKTVTAVATQG